MNEESIQVTIAVIDALEKLGIRYLLSGSLASSLYGEPRATRDADILADLKPEHAELLPHLLEDEFYVSSDSIRQAVDRRGSFNLIHYRSVFKVDIFLPRTKFDQNEFNRRALHTIPDTSRQIYLASIEDIILAKLKWYRDGKEVSNQQWRDVLGMFKANNARLDLTYMKKTAPELDVEDLLQRLITL